MTAAPEVERADARRNRAAVLSAAQAAFAERGLEVSLVEIARRAGVGAGTVHRHFPTKLDLLEAVVQQRVDRLTALALAHRGAPDPTSAFLDFCAAVVTRTPNNKALCDVVESDDGWPRTLLRGAGERFHRAVESLLVAAQREGGVRADLGIADVLTIFTGCVAMQRVSGENERLCRPAALMLAAMRDATKTANSPDERNENALNYVTAARCPICAAPLRHSGAGRPARYCSAACRQKAHRRRRAADEPASH